MWYPNYNLYLRNIMLPFMISTNSPSKSETPSFNYLSQSLHFGSAFFRSPNTNSDDNPPSSHRSLLQSFIKQSETNSFNRYYKV